MTCTLISDGTSDRVLIPILTWSLQRLKITPVLVQWPDRQRMPRREGENWVRVVLDLYPCDLLFYHRDAETQSVEARRREIEMILAACPVRHIPVVPVRMTEAWLLADEKAIRTAAGNPNGNVPLQLPPVKKLEETPDPKAILHDALVRASGLNARRRSYFHVQGRVQRIPQHIDDFSILGELPAFRALQADIVKVVTEINQFSSERDGRR